MKIIVGGSRDFTDFKFLKNKLDKLTAKLDKKKLIIVHGGAEGADTLASMWARKNMVTELVYKANWKKHGNSAGPIRNAEMSSESGAKKAIFFWNGSSAGTKDCIAKCKKKKMDVRIYTYEEE